MHSFGKVVKLSIFGKSHDSYIGLLLEGIKPGIVINKDIFLDVLKRRRPSKYFETKRCEQDQIDIISGTDNGLSNGLPICILIKNSDIKKSDYNYIFHPRPGHADFVQQIKYNYFLDISGGAISSGRMTLPICLTYPILSQIYDFKISSSVISLKGCFDQTRFDDILKEAIEKNDSVGGVVKIVSKNCPIGLGEPFFDSIESVISHFLFSIPGVKGVSFGIGFDGQNLFGSEFNDLYKDKNGSTFTNNSGGVNGGISNGNELVINVFLRPSSSIGISQKTYNFEKEELDFLNISGRHDASFIFRAQVVLESAVNFCLFDLLRRSKKWMY